MSSRRVSSTKHNQTIDTPYQQETKKTKEEIENYQRDRSAIPL
jgi:hypothetical protein